MIGVNAGCGKRLGQVLTAERSFRRRIAGPALSAALWIAALAAGAPAQAQDANLIKPGDAVVTGYSGVKTEANVPADTHPLDRTFIDLDGASARFFDMSALGSAPRGQLSDVPATLSIKARDIGQVFGAAVDDGTDSGGAPNAYVAATSLFGLNLVGKSDSGRINRLLKGQKGAEWMAGQFGPGGAGAIYKIDGKTGKAAVFATLKADGRENGGAGLGNIAFDAKTAQFFVSDLETGLIYRILRNGAVRSAFDHGVNGRQAQGLDPVEFDASKRLDIASKDFNSEDPATWGYAEDRRRVFGLAVHRDRVFYGAADGPSIWSVGLDKDGEFADDARLEFDVIGTPDGTDVTDIAFDGAGLMYLTQRGAPVGSYDYASFATPQRSVVRRYRFDEQTQRWSEKSEEYAIGLQKGGRATQGGLAFGYGYDKNGAIDRGACRQTLWTTGEQLREGDDLKMVSLGGASAVNGLQGVYLSSVLPDNNPPTRSWFADYDGRVDDAATHGRIGDVAIFAPCLPEVRTDTLIETYVPPYTPPVDDPGLILEKRCFAGPIGGKIKCTISVTNVGDVIAAEDVKIFDLTKAMFGPGAGGIIPVVAFAVPNPAILCAAAPSPDFWCTIPAALLPPGAIIAFDVWVDTHPLLLAGGAGFRNCAVMKHPLGFGTACAEGGADIYVEKIGPGTCIAGAACKFGLKIGNAGFEAFDGDVLLADALFKGGAVLNAPVTSVAPPIACIAGDTNQLPFTCLTHLSLMPGEEQIHWIEATMPAPGGYWAQNCFGALDPALVPVGPVPPGFGFGGAGNPSCVWVQVKAPSPNLRVEKTAMHGGLCAKAEPDLICDFEVKLINEDAVAFSAPVTWAETLPAGATINSITAPYACAGGPPVYACDTAAVPINIPAFSTVSLIVSVKIPVVDSEANLCKVPNTVKLAVPAGGAAPNVDATDDEASAQALTLGLYWEDPITGITFVMCDPTNQVVAKKVTTPFVKTAAGFEGAYAVTITNTGPDPYKGPYKLDEKFGVAPTAVSFEGGDFNCVGAGANYACETPIVEMAVGEVRMLKVKATFPDNGACEAPNTASLTMPPAGSRGNGKGEDDSASATAPLPSETCAKPPTTSTPPVERCPDGLPIPRSGKCPCAVGATWNSAANVCDGGGDFVDDDVPQGCIPGVNEVATDSGRCICRANYERDVNGRCRPELVVEGCKPGPNEIKTAAGRCICRDGFVRNNDRRCVPERIDCGKGKRLVNGKCVSDDPSDQCRERGWMWTGKRCVEPPTAEERCRALDKVWTGSRCIDRQDPGDVCRKAGGRWTGIKCVYPPKECPRNYVGTPPNCRLKLPDTTPKCPLGSRGKWPNCVLIQDRKCPPGFRGTPPNCIRPAPPQLNTTPRINPNLIKPKPNFGTQNQFQQKQ
ncbi:MAG: hypothetical protein ACT4OU_08245 [Hyphomicrobium sp.]